MDEKIKTEKRPWQKPELIVLVQSKPDEAVLSSCNTTSTGYAGATTQVSGCQAPQGPGFCLVDCSTLVKS